MKGFSPIIDSTGKITGYKTQAGADTVFPFNGGKDKLYEALQYSGFVNSDMTFEQMCDVLAQKYPLVYRYCTIQPYSNGSGNTQNGINYSVRKSDGSVEATGSYRLDQIIIIHHGISDFIRIRDYVDGYYVIFPEVANLYYGKSLAGMNNKLGKGDSIRIHVQDKTTYYFKKREETD